MKQTAALRRHILDRRAVIGVVGQGYVGLTMACAAAQEGFRVVGIDSDAERIRDLSRGELTVPGVDEVGFDAAAASGRLTFSGAPSLLAEAEVTLITVPTPLRDGTPDLSFVEDACRSVAATLRPSSLVILESTTYPGTTEELVRPLLETSGMTAGRDFLLAYSPERIDPGNSEFGLRNTPRVVGGHTPEATGMVTLFYEQLVDKVVAVSSCRAAELAKLLENTFRHVNIGLVNELAMLGHELGADIWEVLDAAGSKPFGFMRFQPGPGVGGHCIPLDPTYLAWQVRRDAGRHIRILEQAQDVNGQMPTYVVTRIAEALNERGLPVKGRKILVLGVSYKADVGDIRESPALPLISLLQKRGASVGFQDPFVEQIEVDDGVMYRTELSNRALAATDCVVLLTPHSAYDLDWIASRTNLVFDTRNAFGADRRDNVVRL